MFVNFTSTIPPPSVVPVTATNTSVFDAISLDALTILVAVGLAVLIALVAVYMSCCESSAKEQKLYAINHPEEVRNAMNDMGLM